MSTIKKPLCIVHVITRLLRAGSEENTIKTCLGHAALGHKVVLVHGRDFDPVHYQGLHEQISLCGLPEMVHPIAPLSDARAIVALRRLLRELKPDIVHTHQSKAGVIGRIAAHLESVPHIVHGVHIAPFQNVGTVKRKGYTAAERLVGRYTDAFICVSKGMRDAYLEAGIGSPSEYHVVYSGMPIERFVDAEKPEKWRDLIGVDKDAPKPPILLMLAAFEPRKRHKELLEIFPRVVERFPEVRLLFAGDGPMRAEVEAAVAAAGLSKNVRMLGFHPRPWELISLSDVCLLTSIREGLPRVVVQYIAGGRPVIASSVPSLDEILKNDVSGIICRPDELNGFADAIIDLLSNSARYQALLEGAKKTDVSSWTDGALVSGTMEVYETLAPVTNK